MAAISTEHQGGEHQTRGVVDEERGKEPGDEDDGGQQDDGLRRYGEEE
jgi:hypothetical protein